MKFGFSFSPGGLLLPYHVGVLTSLSNRGFLTPSTPIAGSSAGAIAVGAHGVGIHPERVIESTIRINEKAKAMGGARGRLLPLLYEELERELPQDAHHIANTREGIIGIAYREIFPNERNILQTNFQSKEDFMIAICNSSMFPFFSTNWPCLIRMPEYFKRDDESMIDDVNSSNLRSIFPRLIVDGFFTVPRDRFGCPEFPEDLQIDRTITVSVFPHESIGLTASEEQDCISAKVLNSSGQFQTLLERATQYSTERVCWEMYEDGISDAKRWMDSEEEC